MSYITAEFARRVAMPPRPKPKIQIPPGKTPLQHMLDTIHSEGHRPKMPPDPQPAFQPANYIPKATTTMKKHGRASISVIRSALGLSEAKAKSVLVAMQTAGKARYVAGNVRAWELTE